MVGQKAAGHASPDMALLYTQTDKARERERVRRRRRPAEAYAEATGPVH